MKCFTLFATLTLTLAIAAVEIINPDAEDVIKNSYIIRYKPDILRIDRARHEALIHAVARARGGVTGVGRTFDIGGFQGYQVNIQLGDLGAILFSSLVSLDWNGGSTGG